MTSTFTLIPLLWRRKGSALIGVDQSPGIHSFLATHARAVETWGADLHVLKVDAQGAASAIREGFSDPLKRQSARSSTWK